MKPGILSKYKKERQPNFSQLKGRTFNDSYMSMTSYNHEYEKKEKAQDYLMNQSNRTSCDWKKESPFKDRGTRNSITTMTEVIPSLFTQNSSINIDSARQAEMNHFRKRSICITNISQN